MDLSLYNIIVGPVISDKAYKLNKTQNKLMLKVHISANKPMVKEALEKLFSVKVKDINVSIRKGKIRRVKGRRVRGQDQKIVIVSLVAGHKINLFDQAGAIAVEPSAKNSATDYNKRVR